MFTKEFQLSELANYWTSDGKTLLALTRVNKGATSEHPIQVEFRLYCLSCLQSEYHTVNYQEDVTRYCSWWNKEKSLFFQGSEPYRCPHCGQEHQKQGWTSFRYSNQLTAIKTRLPVSFLSDLNEAGRDLLNYLIPKQVAKWGKEALEGYQLFRYEIHLSIQEDTLEILPTEVMWNRAYFYVGQGIEVAYRQEEVGNPVKISRNHAFSDIYAKNYSGYPELFFLKAQSGPTVLNRTGLRNYIESIQEEKQNNRNCVMGFKELTQVYRYERLREDFPCVEQLAKCGYTNLIRGIIDAEEGRSNYSSCTAMNLLNVQGTNPSRILGYPKAVLKRLKQLGVFEKVSTAMAFAEIQKDQPIELKMLEALDESVTIQGIAERRHLIEDLHSLGGYSCYELVEYAKRAWLGQVLRADETWLLLRDYVRMATMMNVSYERFPRYLKVTHDLMQRNFKLKEDEIIQKKFEENVQQYKHLCYAPQGEDYLITIPTKTEDLVKEGHELSHCVASYVKQVSQGETMILFLRKKENPDKPFITIEWKEGRVVQVKGFGNSLLEAYPEAKQFFTKWMKQIKESPQTKCA